MFIHLFKALSNNKNEILTDSKINYIHFKLTKGNK